MSPTTRRHGRHQCRLCFAATSMVVPQFFDVLPVIWLRLIPVFINGEHILVVLGYFSLNKVGQSCLGPRLAD